MAKQDNGLINHVVAVRTSVIGTGYFKFYLHSNDDVYNETLTPIVMTSTSGRKSTVLSNFKNDEIQIEFKTTSINETFTLNTIIAYIKPSTAGYPQ